MTKGKKEVDYKTKAGTAWSHAYLNQKPWHPLSYPNQRRKWIAEQIHAQKEQRTAEVAREFVQEQEFFRQTAQMSKKEKEKLEALQAVSFMYMRPPGYNAEAARAAELADERKKLGCPTAAGTSGTGANAVTATDEGVPSAAIQEKKKPRERDVFGRTLPTDQEFPALKDAPRHETGAPTRVKPFAIEIRNVRCARCGAFGHQSGDRECPMKDVLMPNEEARLRREDPLNVILAQAASDEPVTWELKQKPGGLSPARGGFKPDDPNQQIIPDEDIFDEYGGFLPGGGEDGILSMPNLLASLSHDQRKELTDANCEKTKTTRKHKKERHRRKDRSTKKSDSVRDYRQQKHRHSDDEHSDSSNDKVRNHKSRVKKRVEISDDDHRGQTSKSKHRSYSGDGDQGSGLKKADRELVLDKDGHRRHRSRHKRESHRIDKKVSRKYRDTDVSSSSDDDKQGRRDDSKQQRGDDPRVKKDRRGSTDYETRSGSYKSDFLVHSHRKERIGGKQNEESKKRQKKDYSVQHSSSPVSNTSSSTGQ